jgi:hypothetical protein
MEAHQITVTNLSSVNDIQEELCSLFWERNETYN